MEIISNGNAYSSKVWPPARAHYMDLRHQGWVVRALRSVVPHVSLENLSGLLLALALVAPRMITYLLVYPCCRLVFGTLYPAYASYKAVRAKNLKEYVKWMMYWIVFALFTCAETFTDVFLSWFPFYYEVKIVLVMWLLSPATGGSSILYRKFVHPALCRREQEIDEYISKAKEQGYHTVLNLGTKGVNYATTVIMQTAIKGGGGLVQQLKKSYSLVDLSDSDQRSRSEQELLDEVDDVLTTDPRLIRRGVARRGYSPRRSASESNNRMYFSEVDISRGSSKAGRNIINDFSHIKSSEDISSGYSSADNSATRDATLTRTASVGASTRTRTRQMATRSTFTTIKRPSAAEANEVIIEELHDDDIDDDDISFPVNIYPQYATSPSFHLSQTNPPFLFEIVDNKINIIKILGSTVLDAVNFKTKAFVNKHLASHVNDSLLEANLSDDVKVKANEGSSSHDDQNISLKQDNVESPKCAAELTKSNDSEVSTGDIQIKVTNTCESNMSADNIVTLSDDVISIASENVEMLNVKNLNISNSNSSVSLHSNKMPLRQLNDDSGDTTSLDTSVANMSTCDSDDNGSFVTPESSPVMRKKKLKHTKRKAPSPPSASHTVENSSIKSMDLGQKEDNHGKTSSAKISKSDVIHSHKNKPKLEQNNHDSPISKLMQLPGKFAFWQKTASTSGSENNSRRTSVEIYHVLETRKDSKCSSSIDFNPEDTHKLMTNTNTIAICSDSLSVKDNYEASILSKDAENIVEKGTILQKLIEAKLDSHPEYKIISLHDNLDLLPGSKSTEV